MQIVVSGTMAQVMAPLRKIAGGKMGVLENGLSDGGDKVRTKVRKALKTQTNVKKYGTITSRVQGARRGLSYVITGEGKGLPIDEFPVSAPGSVSASPWGVMRKFKRSFVRAGKFVARLSSKRFPVRRLYGPSIAKEIVKDQSLAAFEAGVRTDIVPEIDKRLARLLSGG
jgi:hypothetical protein